MMRADPSVERRRRVALGLSLIVVLLAVVLWRSAATVDLAPARPEHVEEAPSRTNATPQSRVRVSVPVPSEPPAEEVADTPPLPPSEPEWADFVVRDVWNDAPVTSITFELGGAATEADLEFVGARRQDESAPWTQSADMTGTLRLPRSSTLARAVPGDSGWRLVCTESGSDGRKTVWVYASLTVRGEIRARAVGSHTLDMSTVNIHGVAVGEDAYPGRGASSDPPPGRTERWLTQYKLVAFDGLATPDDEGRFTASIPRVRGLIVIAMVEPEPGNTRSPWRSVSAKITHDIYTSLAGDLQMVFERGFDVHGVVRDDVGEVVSNARITLHVVVEMDDEDVTPSTLRQYGHAYTASSNPTTGKWLVDFQVQAFTDETGRFELTSSVGGDATIWIEPSTAHRVAVLPIGKLSEVGPQHTSTVRRVRASERVRVVDASTNMPLRATKILLADISDQIVQQALIVELGADGSIPAKYLQSGHRYTVMPRGDNGAPLGGRLEGDWDGTPELRVMRAKVN